MMLYTKVHCDEPVFDTVMGATATCPYNPHVTVFGRVANHHISCANMDYARKLVMAILQENTNELKKAGVGVSRGLDGQTILDFTGPHAPIIKVERI